MSALDTAGRIIDWVILGAVGSPPRGDLLNAEALARPPESLKAALGQMTVITAARLRLDSPTLGQGGHLGASEVVLAAALGALHQPVLAHTLLQAVPLVSYPVQWVTRHGLVAPVLPFLSQDSAADLSEACLLTSPFTALLANPPQTQQSDLVKFALDLLEQPAGRRLLQLTLAEPAPAAGIRCWRQELLERLRLVGESGREFVLDVYEAMLIHYPEQALQQVHTAHAVITDTRAAADEKRLHDALTIANGWQPLWALQRSHPEALRARRYLGYEYREGIALYRLAQRLTGGAP